MTTDIILGQTKDGAEVVRREPAPDVESASDGYARRFAGDIGRYFLDVQAKALMTLAAPWLPGTFLDVGGGHAQLAPPLVAAGATVTVTGSTPVCRARLDLTLAPGSYQFVCGDLLHLPFPDKSFDVVTAFRLLPHMDSWREFLRELCRLARHAVIVDYPDIRSVNIVQKPLFHLKRGIERDTRPFRCFNRSEIRSSLGAAGFGDARFIGQFLFPMAFHRAHGSIRVASATEWIGAAVGATAMAGSPVVVRAVPIQS
jgi:hypothetical protein